MMLNTKEIRFFQKIGFLKPPLFDAIEHQRNPIFPKNRISHNVQYLVDPYYFVNFILTGWCFYNYLIIIK
jgi:hypothetical protein